MTCKLLNMVARDGVEPPTPAFSDPKQQALPTTYKPRETAEVLANTGTLDQMLTKVADGKFSRMQTSGTATEANFLFVRTASMRASGVKSLA